MERQNFEIYPHPMLEGATHEEGFPLIYWIPIELEAIEAQWPLDLVSQQWMYILRCIAQVCSSFQRLQSSAFMRSAIWLRKLGTSFAA